MKKYQVSILAFVLAALGLGLAGYKALVLNYPIKPAETIATWVIEARLSFSPTGGSVKANLLLPKDIPGFSILDENFISRGYGLATEDLGSHRQAVWSMRRPSGAQALYYRATLVKDESSLVKKGVPALAKTPDFEEPYKSAVLAVMDEVRSRSADIATFSSTLIRELSSSSPSENVQLLVPKDAGRDAKVRTAISMLATAKIPARMVHGFKLVDGARDMTPLPWIEVNNGNEWVAIDPQNGSIGYPENFVVWWRGDTSPFEITRAKNGATRFSATRSVEQALETASLRAKLAESKFASISLLNLPVQTQNLYRTLLLVPLGTLLIVFLRNIIGIRTFGTFMPVLIALSFRETQLVSGLILFSLIIGLGLLVRFYLEKLKLLLVPRLASVVIIVILIMAGVTMVANELQLEMGLSVALFPMVILAMTIERMSLVWEEKGAGDAIKQGSGSMAVAAVCYLIMFHETSEHLVFVFPELLLVVLAITLLLGRYTGYRLSELVRFRELAAASAAPKEK